MRLAITADVHLRSYNETPARYKAFGNIVKQATSTNISNIVICGDLFDKDFNNYSDFEQLATYYKNISFLILPGNHDANISSKYITGKNIKIFEQPEIVDGNFKLLFVPYNPGKTMGEIIAAMAETLYPRKWVLFGHGDWSDGLRKINPVEPGVYMPLTRVDIDQYMPARTILGHIHVQSDGTVVYPGSPCGLDITETGKRRFIVYDNDNNNIESQPIETDFIFQECQILVLPVEDEETFIKQQIRKIIKSWEISEKDFPKIILRVKAKGYSKIKRQLEEIINREFQKFSYYKAIPPDTSEVYIATDINLIKIAEEVKQKIDSLELIQSPDEPDRDLILMHALKLIFEG
jgi:exonuclease SbcD